MNIWTRLDADGSLRLDASFVQGLSGCTICKFVLEVRRKDGNHYPPNTLHQLCCGVLRQVREVKPGLDIFKDAAFASFRRTLDAEMKRLRSIGIGCDPKQPEPISLQEEELLWSEGLLGDHSPQVLVDTMLFLAGKNFALRSGEEHRQLCFSSVQMVQKPGVLPYLLYTERVSKNHQGGLKHRKVKPKQVVHHANVTQPERCFIELFKKYRSHRPECVRGDAFYLCPLVNAKGNIWYKNAPIGVNTLASTIKRLCTKAGIDGYKTNHSLRVSTATRLYVHGIDEQLIMERTGHRSIDGVRAYKRSSVAQQEVLSRVLNGENMNPPDQRKESQVQVMTKRTNLHLSWNPRLILITDMLVEKWRVLLPSQAMVVFLVLHFSGCSGITINYHM